MDIKKFLISFLVTVASVALLALIYIFPSVATLFMWLLGFAFVWAVVYFIIEDLFDNEDSGEKNNDRKDEQ